MASTRHLVGGEISNWTSSVGDTDSKRRCMHVEGTLGRCERVPVKKGSGFAMVGTSCSSSSSSASFGSFDEDTVAAAKRFPGAATIKFLCSYGGKILPRYPDGKLRYIGGDTRVLAVDRSVPFSELQEKMREMCGWGAVSVRCQLPTEDLDALVSVKSDEDLANIMEEYDRAGREKIRAFLFPPSPIPRSPTHPA
ncbi:hypothetical protein GW17_00056902, partial [Ensete ventricosum]